MEDDDEIQSTPPNGRIAVTVASSAPPPTNSLTLALPIQHQQHKTPSSSSGGREDCWSEGATAVLIDAWGERYLELSRGNLKQKHWKDVADIVSSRDDYSKTPKTDVQCKNRIDTVKKKYKIEKAKLAGPTAPPSKWPFFHKLDQLIGPTAKINSTPPPVPIAGVRSSSLHHNRPRPTRKKPPLDSDDDDDDDDDTDDDNNSLDSSDGLPPQTHIKRPRMVTTTTTTTPPVPLVNNNNVNKMSDGNSWGNSMRELTRAILKFGEAYEQAETAKLQQLVEMEKQRMKFAKDLELQRMQYFMKTQLELSQLKNRRPRANNNRGGHGMVTDNNNAASNNNNINNSDSSN